MTANPFWRWAIRLLWIAIALNILYIARFALLIVLSNLAGGRDEESVIQFTHWNAMQGMFILAMLSRQIPELLCLQVLCASLVTIRRFARRRARIAPAL